MGQCKRGFTAPGFGKRLVEAEAAKVDLFPWQKISAQSPPRPDATISRLDLPSPRVGGRLPQALVSGLQHLEVELIGCDSLRRLAGNLPRRYWRPGQPCPKSSGPPYQADRSGPVWHLILVRAESLLLLGLNRDHSLHLTPHPAARAEGKFHHAIGPNAIRSAIGEAFSTACGFRADSVRALPLRSTF